MMPLRHSHADPRDAAVVASVRDAIDRQMSGADGGSPEC
jgi:hypothetical protein